MADVPVSDLPLVTTAVQGDKLIINKSDLTTSRIDFFDLIKEIASDPDTGGFTSAPIFHNFTSNFTFTASSWAGSVQNIINESVTLKMPTGTNRAIVSWQYGLHAEARVGITASVVGQSYAAFGRGMNITGGGVQVIAGSNSANSLSHGCKVGFPHEPQGTQTPDKIDAQGIQIRPTKFFQLAYNDGASITFQATGTQKQLKQVQGEISAGRFILYAYNSAAVGADAVTAFLQYTADDAEISDSTQEDEERAHSNLLRERMRYYLDQGDNAVRYDTSLTAGEISTVQAELVNVYNLKSNTTLSYAQMEAELDRIGGVLGSILGFDFGWQSIPLSRGLL